MYINSQPLISIVLPTYNREKMLAKAVNSVISQSYSNWELLVIDDASNDGTEVMMKNWNKKDERIKYFRIPVTKELGISKFLNFGINNSKGKYIARIDDDDSWCDVNKLRKQVDFLENNPDYVVCGGGVIIVDENCKERYRYFKNETDTEIRKKILYSNPFTHPTTMFRRDKAVELGGYLPFEHAEDWDFWLRLGKVGKLYNFPEYFANYFLAYHNISLRDPRTLGKMLLELIKKYKNDYPNYRKAYFLNSLQYLYSFIPSFIRKRFQHFLMYIKRKYF